MWWEMVTGVFWDAAVEGFTSCATEGEWFIEAVWIVSAIWRGMEEDIVVVFEALKRLVVIGEA